MVDLLRSVAVRRTEASSRLRRTWLRQAQDTSSGPRGVLEIRARGSRRVSKANFIVNSIAHISLSFPEWQISYGEYPGGPCRILDPRIFATSTTESHPTILPNATRSRLMSRISAPLVSIRDHITSTTKPNPHVGAQRWHAAGRENEGFVASITNTRGTCQYMSQNRFWSGQLTDVRSPETLGRCPTDDTTSATDKPEIREGQEDARA